ncbi:MAG: hypothetical protein AAGF85_02570 [Bacteroidota bacterium]
MKVYLTLVAMALSFLTGAQDRTIADSLFNAKEWNEASKAFKKIVEQHSSDSSAWFKLGVSQMSFENYSDAIASFKRALDTNYPETQGKLALAKAFILNGDKKSMYQYLNESIDSGLAAYAFVKNESAFSDFLSEAEFIALLEKIKLNAYPCLSAKNYRHFDFWLGTWDVYANGRKAGVNIITMAEGGCAIHESYTTQGNYSGQSINFYDPIDKKWHQHWVGSSGDVYNYLETDRGPGLLQFESKYMGPNGQISLSRLTFTLNEDGSVRQLFESSTDQGKTWTAAFDGLYKKTQ